MHGGSLNDINGVCLCVFVCAFLYIAWDLMPSNIIKPWCDKHVQTRIHIITLCNNYQFSHNLQDEVTAELTFASHVYRENTHYFFMRLYTNVLKGFPSA